MRTNSTGSDSKDIGLKCLNVECCASDLPCQDRLRHTILTIRLTRAYVAYCVICCLLSAVAFVSTLMRSGFVVTQEAAAGGHQWWLWERYLDVVVGFVVCAETLATLWLLGLREFLNNAWCIFDASVVALTLLTWLLIIAQRTALLRQGALELDLPLLALRFVLQPCRFLATASLARRARAMQKGGEDLDIISFDLPGDAGGLEPETPLGRLLSRTLEAQLRQHLPAWCCYSEWSLAYSPSAHGTSMRTFYRLQPQAWGHGANLILVKDAAGGVFGGFSSESWRPCSSGYHGSGDCFVFVMRAGGVLECFHHVTDRTVEVLLWGDVDGFSLGGAVALRDDFERGTSEPCAAFGSPCLSKEGRDFTVLAFECWFVSKGPE